jgi:aldose 1-epimerase
LSLARTISWVKLKESYFALSRIGFSGPGKKASSRFSVTCTDHSLFVGFCGTTPIVFVVRDNIIWFRGESLGIWSKLGAFANVIAPGLLTKDPPPLSKAQGVAPQQRSVEKEIFGRLPDGTEIESYTLRNRRGSSAKLITFGASLTQLWVPDRAGKLADVVLGLGSLQAYLDPHPFFGGTIGRYANRIAKGHFVLEGREYRLAINNPPNSLHGGKVGFDRRVWNAESVEGSHGQAVRFAYVSNDGEEHYPGNVRVTVTYTLTEADEFKLEYTAATDKATPLNLTNHSYFNLSGSSDILGHLLYLNADQFTPVDATLIPTGEIRSVAGTPFDFRSPMAIGARIAEIAEIGGYDHNFVLNGRPGTLRIAARLAEPGSGRQMEVWTTEPAIQFYSGIHLDGSVTGKGGAAYKKFGGLCLETQHYPDSPNHPNFPSAILRPGSLFRSETIYKFSAK